MEPLRPRGRPALAARARLPDRPPPAPPPRRGGPLGRPRPPRAPGRPRLLRARAGPLARPRRRRRRRAGLRPRRASCSPASTSTSTSRPPPGRRSSCSASCASSAGAPGAPPPRRRSSSPSPSRRPASRSWPRRSSAASCWARAGGALARAAAWAPPRRWRWASAWRSRRRSCCSSRARWPAARAGRVSRRTSCSPTRSTRSRSSRRSSGGLYGNLSNLAGEWWGQNFFPRGFPYVLSLYLGAAALAVAAVGARPATRSPAASPGSLALGLVVSVGRWAGLAPVVDALPALRLVRYPVKAFYTAHFAVALLAALGLASLAGAADRRPWRRLAVVAGGAGALLAAGAARARARAGARPPPSPRASSPPASPPTPGPRCSRGSWATRPSGAPSRWPWPESPRVLALRPALAAPRAAAMVVALVAADLLRTGAGLNPMVTAAFFRPSPELEARLASLAARAASSAAVSRRARPYLAARVAAAHGARGLELRAPPGDPDPRLQRPAGRAHGPEPRPHDARPRRAGPLPRRGVVPRPRRDPAAPARGRGALRPLRRPARPPRARAGRRARARAHRPARRARLPPARPRFRAPRPSAPRASSRPPSARTASSWSSRRTGRRRWCCATAGPRAGRRASTDVPPRFARAEGTARSAVPAGPQPGGDGLPAPGSRGGARRVRARPLRGGRPGAPAEAPGGRPRAGRAEPV